MGAMESFAWQPHPDGGNRLETARAVFLSPIPDCNMLRHGSSFDGAYDDRCTGEDTVAHLVGWLNRGAVQLHRGFRFRDDHGAGCQVLGQCWYDAGSDRPLSTDAELDDGRLGDWLTQALEELAAMRSGAPGRRNRPTTRIDRRDQSTITRAATSCPHSAANARGFW